MSNASAAVPAAMPAALPEATPEAIPVGDPWNFQEIIDYYQECRIYEGITGPFTAEHFNKFFAYDKPWTLPVKPKTTPKAKGFNPRALQPIVQNKD